MMPTLSFATLDVFTERRFGGNPLAVFPQADGVDPATMLALARELNLSEVAFVQAPRDPANTARLRIFTSEIEIDFAGHPNVGVGWLLAEHGRDRDGLMRFEQGAGVVEVRVTRRDGELVDSRVAAPRRLEFGQPPPRDELAACAGLAADDIRDTFLASVGLATVCASVSADALARARCEPAAFRAVAARRPDLAQIFLLSLYVRDGSAVRQRVFAPLSGTIEDPATGSAAAALTAGLLAREGGSRIVLDVTQGAEIGRPSRILTEARQERDGVRAWISGRCVHVLRGEAQV